MSMDKQYVMLLVMFDLSVVFDIVCYLILISCLESKFGVKGVVFEWVCLYFLGCIQWVFVKGVVFENFDFCYGVLQGLCFGFLLFFFYIFKLFDIIK